MKRRILPALLLTVFLAGAAVAGYKIITIRREYRAGEKTYQQMQQYVQVPEEHPEPVEPGADAVTEETAGQTGETEGAGEAEGRMPLTYPQVDFDALWEVNGDVVGWICLEDTRINYPVLQGTDNRYYVSTLIDGSYNGAGSIFMDYHNAADFSDRHTVLYGHNMGNGTMFADITRYRDQEYYEAHPVGMIVTPEKNLRFEIVAGYVASLADPAWQLEFVDEEDVAQWLEDARDRSGFESERQLQPGERLLTLSTCTYEFDDARFVLVGILTEE